MTTMEDSAAIIARLNQEWTTFTSTQSVDGQTRKTAEMAVTTISSTKLNPAAQRL